MANDEVTFELWRRGEKVESFTGPRHEAKAQAEARLAEYKMSDLAFIRETALGLGAVPTAARSSRIKPLNIIIVIIVGSIWFWTEFF